MRQLLIATLSAAFIFALPALAAITDDQAYEIASKALNTDNAELDQESDRTYFFVDAGFDEDAERPCINGVMIDKATGNVVTPDEQNDPKINVSFAYSDTHIERDTKIIVNCAD